MIAYLYRVDIFAEAFKYAINDRLDISEGLKKEMVDLIDPVKEYMMSDRLVPGSDDAVYIAKVVTKIRNNSDYQSGLVEGVRPIDDNEAREIVHNLKGILGLNTSNSSTGKIDTKSGEGKHQNRVNDDHLPIGSSGNQSNSTSPVNPIYKCTQDGLVVYSDEPCS